MDPGVLMIGSYMQILSACFGPLSKSDLSSRLGQLEDRSARGCQIGSSRPVLLEEGRSAGGARAARLDQVCLSRPDQLEEARSAGGGQVRSAVGGLGE